MPGPAGKHPDRRHGHRTKAENAYDSGPALLGEGESLTWPEPGEHWHPYAADWYRSLAISGQAISYTPSDVHTARILAENLSRCLVGERPIGGNALSAWLTGAGDLLVTAGARRRAKLELESGPNAQQVTAEDSAVASLGAYRRTRGA